MEKLVTLLASAGPFRPGAASQCLPITSPIALPSAVQCHRQPTAKGSDHTPESSNKDRGLAHPNKAVLLGRRAGPGRQTPHPMLVSDAEPPGPAQTGRKSPAYFCRPAGEIHPPVRSGSDHASSTERISPCRIVGSSPVFTFSTRPPLQRISIRSGRAAFFGAGLWTASSTCA